MRNAFTIRARTETNLVSHRKTWQAELSRETRGEKNRKPSMPNYVREKSRAISRIEGRGDGNVNASHPIKSGRKRVSQKEQQRQADHIQLLTGRRKDRWAKKRPLIHERHRDSIRELKRHRRKEVERACSGSEDAPRRWKSKTKGSCERACGEVKREPNVVRSCRRWRPSPLRTAWGGRRTQKEVQNVIEKPGNQGDEAFVRNSTGWTYIIRWAKEKKRKDEIDLLAAKKKYERPPTKK